MEIVTEGFGHGHRPESIQSERQVWKCSEAHMEIVTDRYGSIVTDDYGNDDRQNGKGHTQKWLQTDMEMIPDGCRQKWTLSLAVM